MPHNLSPSSEMNVKKRKQKTKHQTEDYLLKYKTSEFQSRIHCSPL